VKKKYLAIFMVGFLGMSGCQFQVNKTIETETQVEETSIAVKTNTPVTTDDILFENDEKKEIINMEGNESYGSFPELQYKEESKSEVVNEENGDMCYCYCQRISADGKKYPELAGNIATWELDNYSKLMKRFDNKVDMIKNTIASSTDKELSMWCYMGQRIFQKRADKKVLSFVVNEYVDEGYEKGEDNYIGINFDTETGKELELQDVVRDVDGFKKFSINYINEILLAYSTVLDKDKDIIEKVFDEVSWYLDDNGIVMVFNGTLGNPFPKKGIKINIPYTKVWEFFYKDYIPVSEGAKIVKIDDGFPLYASLGGEERKISLAQETNEENGWLSKLNILVNGEEHVIFDANKESFYYNATCYYFQNTDGKQYVLVEYLMDNDYRELKAYEYLNDEFSETDTVQGGLVENTLHAQDMQVRTAVHVLGTYSGVKGIYLDAEGKFNSSEDRYRFEMQQQDGQKFHLEVKRKVKVFVDGKENVLKKGDLVYPVGANSEQFFFYLEDGTEGYVIYEEKDYEQQVDGVGVSKIFDGIMYAG